MDHNYDLGPDNPAVFADRSKRFNAADLLRKATRMYADRVAVTESDREITTPN